jgi:hypothetical protein
MNVDLVRRREYQKEEFYKNRKVIYGGFKGKMDWSYYLTGFESHLHQKLEALKEYVTFYLDEMENEFKDPRFCETYFFLFEDRSAFSFTFRSWGDFMAAVDGSGNTYREFYGLESSP